MLQYIEISNVTGVLLYLWKKKDRHLNVFLISLRHSLPSRKVKINFGFKLKKRGHKTVNSYTNKADHVTKSLTSLITSTTPP